MKTYTAEQLKEILASHGKWLRGEADGSRADLRGADLRGADLRGADLRGAFLQRADLLCIGDMRYIKTIQVDKWMIGYTHDTLQIGCQRHPISKWWEFSDEKISEMDSGALAWWKVWKPIIASIIDASPAQPTKGGGDD